ncbi:hypothetical protein GCM10007079_21580 [Nocardiopsis terrae]|nr:hypothetical protein GCM10007079_21580 [Nocardiopsis terrae]
MRGKGPGPASPRRGRGDRGRAGPGDDGGGNRSKPGAGGRCRNALFREGGGTPCAPASPGTGTGAAPLSVKRSEVIEIYVVKVGQFFTPQKELVIQIGRQWKPSLTLGGIADA